MNDPGTLQTVAAGLHLVPAVLWGVIAHNLWSFRRKRRARHPVYLLLIALGGLVALHYALWTVIVLLQGHLGGAENLLRASLLGAIDVGLVLLVALTRHFALLWPVPPAPPGRRWLALNYGVNALVAVALVVAEFGGFGRTASGWSFAGALAAAYLVFIGTAVGFHDLRRLARAGALSAGRLGEIGSLDMAAVFAALACWVAAQTLPLLAGTTPLVLLTGGEPVGLALACIGLHVAGGLVLAVPFALRDLSDTLGGFIGTSVLLAATAATFTGARALGARLGDPELARLLDLGAVLVTVVALRRADAWLRAGIDRLVFRRSRRRWTEMHAFVHTLSPELGVAECARRALAELVRGMQLHGAAMMFSSGEVAAHGALRADALAARWRDWGAALPSYSFGLSRFRDLPRDLAAALTEADVIAVVPIVGARRRWGHVLVSTSLLGASFSDQDDQAVDAAANELALVLDAADLLARALAVERSLAHAEKLAAIGELTARVAHEIRNPVTAARSLAQQLVREPGAPFAEEHALILEELERVERQVAALLRYARREELHLEPVDLGELAAATLEALRPRLDAAGVAVDLDLAAGVVAYADRERLRQVLINLVENAADALSTEPAPRRLAVDVAGVNGTATLRVTDTGPGVPREALPHLFEPFFSLKPTGTGLGLAIARRTVEAHAGRIAAARAPAGGMTFSVELPLGRES